MLSRAGLCLWPLLLALSSAADDGRLTEVRTKDTPRLFTPPATRTEWQRRAGDIRTSALVHCGLWPLPERTPLQPIISGRIERDGYTVENVAIQTHPGFYLAGNLYRPRGQGDGPFPAILNPHGHWSHGRLEDQELGSIAARCINFARQGMVAFAYDMVGYNDTAQVDHSFASEPEHQLWGINLMGLQTWNSIRALDFLASLPDVDAARLGCTGASGGGTQTFMLGAIDPRPAALAPMVMVSHSMQGGCLCENAPGLRVRHSNMDIAAAAAPSPQLLVAATGDWTKSTPDIEGPALASVYSLLDASDHLRYVRFDFPHNYNQTTREQAYRWFGRWLRHDPQADGLQEAPYQKEPDESLLLWPDKKRPADAKSEPELIAYFKDQAARTLQSLRPVDAASWQRFLEVMPAAWRQLMQLELPENGLIVNAGAPVTLGDFRHLPVELGRKGAGDQVPALMISPAQDALKALVVLAHPKGRDAYFAADKQVTGLARQLLDLGHSVVLFDAFLSANPGFPKQQPGREPFQNYFTTHNRTDLQERVRDVITVCAFARTHGKGRRIVLMGEEQAGLWAVLGAPAADAIVADARDLGQQDVARLLQEDLFVPGILRYGGFAAAAAALTTPRPLVLVQPDAHTMSAWVRPAYKAAGASDQLRVLKEAITPESLRALLPDLAKGD